MLGKTGDECNSKDKQRVAGWSMGKLDEGMGWDEKNRDNRKSVRRINTYRQTKEKCFRFLSFPVMSRVMMYY